MNKKLKILHKTFYEFNSEVFIDPHYLRFMPRATPHSSLDKFDLEITPAPIGLSKQHDAENNLVHFCWFNGKHASLDILSESLVVISENNPLDFILFPNNYFDLPFQYFSQLKDMLQPYLIVSKISEPLIEYGNNILVGSACKTLSFVINLTEQIHADFKVESRLDGDPFMAGKTFELKKGSCRDLAWMQIQLLRYMGIAARFVSGYFFIAEDTESELHGWIEIYLPGAGWVGLDPSNGIIAGSSHVPVCSGSHYENTMPVIGSFWGNGHSTLSTKVLITAVP